MKALPALFWLRCKTPQAVSAEKDPYVETLLHEIQLIL